MLLMAVVALPAAEIDGIWTGKMQGRAGQMEDVTFQFKQKGETLTGKMFGDEFDLAIEQASIAGDQVKFIVTTTNYYSRTKIRTMFSGTIKPGEIELTRERLRGPDEKAPPQETPKQTMKLKKIA